MNVTTLQFGIYRDGDNNLDRIQSPVIDQAFETSEHDPLVAFNVEDFTARRDFASLGGRRTESYAIRDGAIEGAVHESREGNASSRAELARFVAHTLDEAQKNGAKATWVDLVDHGGGDGGGLQTSHGLMASDDIAGAIADGVALHAKEHPEDAGRGIDGVVANQCLMATVGFASALSHAGVKFLAASPETMLAPGVPSSVAEAIVHHPDDPQAMAREMVQRTMHTRYGLQGTSYAPAAAFDVIDLDAKKIDGMEQSVAKLDATIATDVSADRHLRSAVLADARSVDGMVRFTDKPYPWHADRPAEALYDTFAHDDRLPNDLRSAAAAAKKAVEATVLAHGESREFAPFGGASYKDSVGPTVHFASSARERDPWAPQISETDTAFYAKVGADGVDRALGTA